jgi:hypothetical protein
MTKKAKRAASGNGVNKTGGQPPEDTKFRSGTSGNPRGRPKGSKNIRTLLMEAARDQVSATIDGKTRKISKAQAAVMQLATKAASGDHRALARFLDSIDEIEMRAAAAKPPEFPLSEEDIQVIHAIYQRMKQSEPRLPED